VRARARVCRTRRADGLRNSRLRGVPGRRRDGHGYVRRCRLRPPALRSRAAADWTLRNDETGLLKALQAHVKTVDEAAAQLLGVVDAATRETDVFMKADGGTYPW
jgi:hypothetical protein